MTTIYTLKEVLHDRIKMLEAGLDQMMNQPRALVITHTRAGAQELGRLEGRLEETRVIFRLVDQAAQDQVTLAREKRDNPLVTVVRHSLEPVDGWGKQPRHNWPDSTFGAESVEAEPGVDRYDPNRC